jgi:hypothetical protein
MVLAKDGQQLFRVSCSAEEEIARDSTARNRPFQMKTITGIDAKFPQNSNRKSKTVFTLA